MLVWQTKNNNNPFASNQTHTNHYLPTAIANCIVRVFLFRAEMHPNTPPDVLPAAESQNTCQSPATVQLHALSAGHFSLPEEQFVRPASPEARRTVPSLSFLIQHVDTTAEKNTTRILFDLGLRR